MIIGVDMLPLKTDSYKRGIGKYTYNLFKTLIDIDTNNTYYFYNIPHNLYNEFTQENTKVFYRNATQYDTTHLDLFFITSLIELENNDTLLPHEINCKSALLFYDLIPIIFWDNYINNLADITQIEYFKRLSHVKDFDVIFTISRTTKNDLITLLDIAEDKIVVIYSGLDKRFLNPALEDDSSSVMKRYGIQNKFILSTVGFDFRKNILGIFNAFSRLNEEVCLVIVCKLLPEEEARLREIWNNLGLPQDRLILTNYVPTDDLIKLYDAAEIFLFPSLYEGFGLPVLEAMSRGCPVITSNISSLPEVCECSAIYIDPNEPESIAGAIVELLSNTELKNKLIKCGLNQQTKFRWDRVAFDVIERLRSLMDYRQEPVRSSEICSVAYFTPLNPLKSGISDYSEDLLLSLKNFINIDIFTDTGYIPQNQEIVNSFNIYSHTEFEYKYIEMSYDLCIYQLGNSTYHEYMLDYIFKYPGIVVLHDMTMCGLTISVCLNGGSFDKSRFLDLTFENHGYNKYLEIKSKLESSPAIELHTFAYDHSINFTKNILDNSIITLVHNDYAKESLEPQSSFCSISKIDMGINLDYSNFEYGRITEDSNKIIISAFGRITNTKRIDILLKALLKLIKTGIDVQLYLVGEFDNDVKNNLLSMIKNEKMENHVAITGFVGKDKFDEYYNLTDICLNLRYPSAGETSATLIKALRFGIPVITTNYAQYKEYPDNCCWKVDLGDYEVELLSEYLLELVTNEKARKIMSKNAYEYARENNSMERAVGQYLKAIDYAIKYKQVVTDRTAKSPLRRDGN